MSKLQEQNTDILSATEAARAALTAANAAATNAALVANDIGYIKRDISEIKSSLSGVQGQYVTLIEFEPIRRIVYGLVGTVLISFIGAILALVLQK